MLNPLFPLACSGRRSARRCARRLALGTTFALGGAALVLAPALNAPALAAPANPDKYILGPGDVLSITVQGFDEFNQNGVVIPPDGVVTLAHYGTIRLSGKTRLQVQSDLAGALRRVEKLRRPVVALAITTFRSGFSGRAVLSGDVPKPGSIELREGQRLSDLLANSGLNERLDEKSAALLRGGKSLALNLSGAAAGPRGVFDVVLRAGDVITVRDIAPGRITLRGAVAHEGVYELHRVPRPGAMEVDLTPRLSDLLIAAGGLQTGGAPGLASGALSEAANAVAAGGSVGEAAQKLANGSFATRYTAFLQRGGARTMLNPEAALNEVDSAENIALRAGDFVTIQTLQPITVYMDGLVGRTGSFQVPPGTGLLELITTAGGLKSPPAEIVGSVRRTTVLGATQNIPLDLVSLMQTSQSASNLTLQNGDIIQLRSPDTLSVRVSGAVKTEGVQNLKPGSTVLDALLGAAGIVGSPTGVKLNVLRRGADGTPRVLPANAAGIVNFTEVSTNYVLQEGDIINVTPIQQQTIYLTGEVNSSGSYQLRQGEGLPELIARAGGVKDGALLGAITVTRAGEQLTVDAYDAIKKGAPLSFDLADSDYVLVPKNNARVLVMEGVVRPGYYPIPERGKLTLLDVLAQAGPQQKTSKVQLLRAREDGTVDRGMKPREISLKDVRNSEEGNIVLQPRDIVYVPTPKNKPGILSLLPLVGVARIFFP